MMIIATSFWHH